jgi:hypothetical protein
MYNLRMGRRKCGNCNKFISFVPTIPGSPQCVPGYEISAQLMGIGPMVGTYIDWRGYYEGNIRFGPIRQVANMGWSSIHTGECDCMNCIGTLFLCRLIMFTNSIICIVGAILIPGYDMSTMVMSD